MSLQPSAIESAELGQKCYGKNPACLYGDPVPGTHCSSLLSESPYSDAAKGRRKKLNKEGSRWSGNKISRWLEICQVCLSLFPSNLFSALLPHLPLNNRLWVILLVKYLSDIRPSTRSCCLSSHGLRILAHPRRAAAACLCSLLFPEKKLIDIDQRQLWLWILCPLFLRCVTFLKQ